MSLAAVQAPGSREQTSDALDASATFRNDFEGYQKITEADYLEHSLLFGVLKNYLASQTQQLRFLDLGCGDAENLSKIFVELSGKISLYKVVDMSNSALVQANVNIKKALQQRCPISFELDDMLSCLKNQPVGEFNFILAAFSVHHLSSNDKKELFKEVHRCLEPTKGVFVMVDPFRREAESLQAYHQRATEVGNTWTFMANDQRERFIKHMQDCDVVEEKQFFEEMSREAGFSSLQILCQGKIGLQSCVSAFLL